MITRSPIFLFPRSAPLLRAKLTNQNSTQTHNAQQKQQRAFSPRN
jgi:hypothetical protein